MDNNTVTKTTTSVLEKYQANDHSMDGVIKFCQGKVDMIENKWRLYRDVYLRMRKLYSFISDRTPEITTAMANEVLKAFFESNDVSFATIGIRTDLRRNTTTLEDGTQCINHFLVADEKKGKEAGSYGEFTEWVNELCGRSGAFMMSYLAKFDHCHCQWREDVLEPKLNCILHGEQLPSSFILHRVARTCPSGVIHTQGNDLSSFNVDRTRDDMLIIAEEAPNYICRQDDSDRNANAVSVLKARLTSGVSTVSHFFLDEKNNNRRDVRYVHTSVDGSYLMATSDDLEHADKHLLSRFVLINVPKSNVSRPVEITDTQLAQHRDLHRIYYIVAMMEKAGVIRINVDRSMLSYTENNIKPCHVNTIIRLTRILCVASTIYRVMVAPEFKNLQYDLQSGRYVGFNVRVLTEGIFPLLIIDKKMLLHAIVIFNNTQR